MATVRKLQQHITAVAEARRRFQNAKNTHDELMATMRLNYLSIFDEYEAARQAKDDAEKAAREAIATTAKDDLPAEFGHRWSTDWELDTEEARQWLLVNLPALMQPVKKDVVKVLNTGVFKRVPIESREVVTPTISEKLGKE